MLWFLFLLVFVIYLLYSQLIANNLEFYSLLRKQKKCKQFAKYNCNWVLFFLKFQAVDFDENFSSLVIAQCGNGIVEDGEECDCGLDHFVCNDPCCYPAYISDSERSANVSAKSCQSTERYWCQNKPGIVYGFYVPWAVITSICLILFGILYRDWHRSRLLFKHITENRVIIK